MAPSPRVTVPVDVDRDPSRTVPLAAAVARQSHTDVEFVAVGRSPTPRPLGHRLDACCEWARREGAPDASWSVIDDRLAIGAYATWSGSGLLCISTGHGQHGLGRAGRVLVRHAAIPVLVGGPRGVITRHGYRRLVVGLDGARPHAEVLAAAITFAVRMDIELMFTQVLPPMPPGTDQAPQSYRPAGDVQESAYLHRIVATAHCPRSSFDTLHAGRPAAGIVRFVGHDEMTITMVGSPAERHNGHGRGRVVRSVIRRSAGPVLVVPTRQIDDDGRPLRPLKRSLVSS